MRLLSKYSVDIVTKDGWAIDTYSFYTNSIEKAEAKFEKYVKKEAFPTDTVQLWSRIKNDNDVQLVKEKMGTASR